MVDRLVLQPSPHETNELFPWAREDAKTYLHLLSTMQLRNVLRHCSTRPYSPDWSQFLHKRHIYSLYCGEGPLSEVYRSAVNTLEIPRPGARHDVDFQEYGLEAANTEVLEKFGASFTDIIITCTPGTAENLAPSTFQWLDPLVKNCTSLIRLDVRCVDWDVIDKILTSLGVQLKSLTCRVPGVEELSCITEHCVGLREACFSLEDTLWLPEGTESSFSHAQPDDIKFPAAIETLSLRGGLGAELILSAVERQCRAVRNICVDSAHSPQVAKLYSSYGRQLQFADLHNLDASLCREVAEACPRAQFQVFLQIEGFTKVPGALAKARLLGSRARIVVIPHESRYLRSSDAEDVAEIADTWTELRTLKIHAWGTIAVNAGRMCRAFLRPSQGQLSDLTIPMTRGTGREVLSVVAACTGRLEKLKLLDCHVSVKEMALLRDAVRANPGMHILEISGRLFPLGIKDWVLPTSIEDALIEILSSIDSHDAMQQVLVKGNLKYRSPRLQTVEDYCVRFRNRRMVVEIFGVTYLA